MTRKTGLAGGFGARYGTVTRRRYISIVTGLRSKHECPRCMFKTVKRWSVGVWHCRKCGFKFAGGAYAPTTKLGEIAARATRGMMSPSTLSTELDSLRGGARVAPSMVVAIKRPRARRRKVVVELTAEPTEKVEAKTEDEAQGETETPTEN
jgi:large subunit ribosomal protein L37Ae